MKKIFVTLFACAALLTSCDMNTEAPGVLDDQTAMDDFQNVENFRNYIYSDMRGCTAGEWVYDSELQMDQFLGLVTNGNRGGQMAHGDMNTSNTVTAGLYGSMYSRIANANYFIGHLSDRLANGSLNEEQTAKVERYLGEAKFARAYYYFWLFDHFCQTYDAAKGDEPALGLCLQKVYEPTGDFSKYPGRSTMNETLTFIQDDLKDAYKALKDYEDAGNVENCVAGAPYLSSYAVEALQARIALATGDYDTAITKAQDVIGNNNYALAEGEDYFELWEDTNVSELIFSPFVDKDEAGTIGSTNEGWNYWISNNQQADYIPTFTTLLMYEDGDLRFDAFFTVATINIQGGQTKGYIFYKYPGNPDLISDSNYYKNNPKPFRLSEQYLILAEAAARSNKPEIANKALNDLRKARFDSDYFEEINLQGGALISMVKEERTRELLGEGFRISDLKRWGEGFTRDSSYPINAAVEGSFILQDSKVVYAANDYRYVWPIPADEMEVNPQLAGQQNPGY